MIPSWTSKDDHYMERDAGNINISLDPDPGVVLFS